MKHWAAVALLAVQPAMAAELIRNPAEVIEVLRQLFPRSEVAANGDAGNGTANRHDALDGEPSYRVSGPLLDEAEKCAATDLAGGRKSQTRKVRVKLFRFLDWTGRSDYVAVLQYAFEADVPPRACPSIARIATLRRRRAGGWEITSEHTPETAEHHIVNSVRVLDLNADGFDELAVESDWGTAGLAESVMLLFDLSSGKLKELAAIPTRILRSGSKPERLQQVLDLASSQREHGLKFCFVKTVYEWNGRELRPPRTTHPCYSAGEGLTTPR